MPQNDIVETIKISLRNLRKKHPLPEPPIIFYGDETAKLVCDLYPEEIKKMTKERQ